MPFSKDFVYYLFVLNSIPNSTQSYNYNSDSTQDKVRNYEYSPTLGLETLWIEFDFFTRNFRISFHIKVFKRDLGFNTLYLINAITIVKINYTGNDIIVSFVFEILPIELLNKQDSDI
jgi:hypothetical protein